MQVFPFCYIFFYWLRVKKCCFLPYPSLKLDLHLLLTESTEFVTRLQNTTILIRLKKKDVTRTWKLFCYIERVHGQRWVNKTESGWQFLVLGCWGSDWPTFIVALCACVVAVHFVAPQSNTVPLIYFRLFPGTTSSSNTVIAGQELFPDTDDAKTLKENEERYTISRGLSYD